ncbi:MAG TPA: hypothetical protein VMJ64_00045 [Anaerolineales bacterium]|nr:hypothetical protein [Anaerolineales bacterium]
MPSMLLCKVNKRRCPPHDPYDPVTQGIPALSRIIAGAIWLLLGACTLTPSAAPPPTGTSTITASTTPTGTKLPSSTPTLIATATPSTPSVTPAPTVQSLKATVTADLLSCRYGPGPNYLFLYGLRKGANIVLIGRTDGSNWRWVYVEGKNKCWVKTVFLDIHGDWSSLPVVYPGAAKLPVSPYYPPTYVLHATRQHDQVTIEWADIPLRAGDEEDERMQHYVLEAWHCVNGQLLFEPIATNELTVTLTDQAGCNTPSHGRIFVQEKHGFAGPADVPWPAP